MYIRQKYEREALISFCCFRSLCSSFCTKVQVLKHAIFSIHQSGVTPDTSAILIFIPSNRNIQRFFHRWRNSIGWALEPVVPTTGSLLCDCCISYCTDIYSVFDFDSIASGPHSEIFRFKHFGIAFHEKHGLDPK